MALRGGTVLAASLCLLAAPAAAQETYRLDYMRELGAEACPSEAAFRAAVSREVGRDPFRPDAPNRLTVVFRRAEKTVRVQIVAKSRSGSEQSAPDHEKPARECAGLLGHAVFSAGMLIDPLEPLEPEQPVAAPASASPQPPAPPPSPPSPPPPLPSPSAGRIAAAPRPEPPTRPLISLAGGAAFGSTPGWSPSLTAGIGLRQDDIAIIAELRWDFGGTRADPPYQIHGSQRLAMIAPCQYIRRRSWLHLETCALIAFGWTQPSIEHDNSRWGGQKIEPTYTANVGFRGGLSFPLGPSFSLFARMDLLFGLDPPAVKILGREIWTYPYASAALQVGLVYAFDVTHPTAKPPPPPLSQKFSPGVGTSEGSDDI